MRWSRGLLFIGLLALGSRLGAGPALDDILNYAVIDASSAASNERITVTSNAPVGGTFTTGRDVEEIFRITVRLDQSPDQWSPGEAVTLALWDSPAKTTKLAEYTLDDVNVKNLINENPFYVRTPAQPNTSYYFEITHNGKGDGKASVFAGSKPGGLFYKVLVKRKADHVALMRNLFADFDLDAPGMDKVKRAVAVEDWEKAVAETVAHFDARPLSIFHNPDARPTPKPGANLDDAERALKNIVRHEDRDFYLGDRVNWWANPTPGKGSPAEKLCNWGLPRTLGHAYMNSADERFAKKADQFYVEWMLDNPPPTKPGVDWNTTAYSGLQIARKLGGNAWYFYGELMKSPNLSLDTRMAFIHFQVELCRLLYSGITSGGDGWGGNWGFQTYDALLDNSLDNPEYAEWRDWSSFAVKKLVTLSHEAICADGVTNEAAPNYHGMCARRLKSLLLRAKERGFAVPLDLRTILGKMYTFVMYLTQPDGSTPMFGDSDSERYSDELAEVGTMLGREDFAYVASGGRGLPSRRASAAFPSSGYYFMRSGFGADDRYLAVHNGNWVGTHGHFDLTAPVIYAHGRPLLVDPGRFEYTAEHDWFWVAKAHNVILMDGRNYENYNHTTRYSHWSSSGLLDYFDGRNEFYKETTFDREIVFVKPDYWLVTDQVYMDGPHKLEQYWHFAPGNVNVTPGTLAASTRYPSGGNLSVIPILREGLTARKEEGFVAFKSGVKETAPVVVYERTAGPEASFLTLIYPWKTSGKPPSVTRLSAPWVGRYAFLVRSPQGDDYLTICRAREPGITPISAGAILSTARVALVRASKTGAVRSFAWVEGRELSLHGKLFARSDRPIGSLNVIYDAGILRLQSNEDEPTLAVRAGKCALVSVNGAKPARLASVGGFVRPFGNLPMRITVDDTDPGFSRMESYEWLPMPDGNPVGISYLQHETDVGRGEWAEWRARIPIAGKYEIQVRIPKSHLPLTDSAVYTITLPNGSTVEKRISQRASAGRWVSLGKHDLRPRLVKVHAVNQSKVDGVYFIADAVRFVR